MSQEDKIINIVDGIAYNQICSDEEYDRELNIFLSEINKLSSLSTLRDIKNSYPKFKLLINKAEGTGLFPKYYCDNIRQRIADGMKNGDLKQRIKDALKRGKK